MDSSLKKTRTIAVSRTKRMRRWASHWLAVENPIRERVNRSGKRKGPAMAKNTICLWYDKDAEAAARFYAATFPDSAVGPVHRAPSDYPSGKEGDVLTVEFTVAGIPCIGLNGGPAFKHNEAFSFQIATDDQEETDRYWTRSSAMAARRAPAAGAR